MHHYFLRLALADCEWPSHKFQSTAVRPVFMSFHFPAFDEEAVLCKIQSHIVFAIALYIEVGRTVCSEIIPVCDTTAVSVAVIFPFSIEFKIGTKP